MRLSDRRDAGAHAQGSGRGLRGCVPARPRRLALSRGALWARALLLLGLVFAAPGPVQPHPLLIESIPSASASLTALPPEIVLRFNNRVEKKLSRVRLIGAGGERLDVPVALTGRADTLTGPLPALTPGPWRLEWQVLSTDGHVVSGVSSSRFAP